MRIVCLLALLSGLALAQTSDLFEKAPPEVDEALRARVMIFYNAFISGKYRDAYKVVAEDAQDDYLAASKDSYSACEVSKVSYKDNFTKATVTTACKGEYRWHGNHMPVTIPALSTWKVVDGKWWWYHIHESAVQTPWGISRELPENMSGGSQMPAIPADPMAAARSILKGVSIDSDAVLLKSSELSKAEVHISNAMPGSITVTVDALPIKGSHVTVTPAEVPAGGKATVTFSYDPDDPSILCGSCTTKVALPTLTANVRIQPTAQVFPVKISFTPLQKK
jgi:hypothetical protein